MPPARCLPRAASSRRCISMPSAMSLDSMRSPARTATMVTDMSLSSVGDLYVTGTAFTSTISSSADVLTLRFAQGGAPVPLPDVAAGPDQPQRDRRFLTGFAAMDRQRKCGARILDRAMHGKGAAPVSLRSRRVAANARSFMRQRLARNTQYSYRVRAFNDASNSAYSNVVGVRTPRR